MLAGIIVFQMNNRMKVEVTVVSVSIFYMEFQFHSEFPFNGI